jgi:hypothetical protein
MECSRQAISCCLNKDKGTNLFERWMTQKDKVKELYQCTNRSTMPFDSKNITPRKDFKVFRNVIVNQLLNIYRHLEEPSCPLYDPTYILLDMTIQKMPAFSYFPCSFMFLKSVK